MLDWHSHVFSVEKKGSSCFRDNNNEILLKCVLISFNKIPSSKGLTFFFEIWGFDQGPLSYLVSANRRELLQEPKLLPCGADLCLENWISSGKDATWLSRAEGETSYRIQKKKSLKISFYWLLVSEWGKSVSAHFWGTQITTDCPLIPALWSLALASLPAIPFSFFLIFVSSIVFVFQFNKIWFPLLCVWLFPSHWSCPVVPFDLCTLSLKAVWALEIFMPCFLFHHLCNSVLERDDGWGKIKMFRSGW